MKSLLMIAFFVALLLPADAAPIAPKTPRGQQHKCLPDSYSAWCTLHCRLYPSGIWKHCLRIPQGR